MRGSCAAKAIGDVGGAVGRIVVDDDHFPGQAGERRLQPLEQHRHVGRFAIGRHDHGEGRAGGHRRDQNSLPRPWFEARGESRAATSVRIRHGKGARQAMRGDERQRDFVAPAAAQRERLRRIEAGEIGRQLRQRLLQPVLRERR